MKQSSNHASANKSVGSILWSDFLKAGRVNDNDNDNDKRLGLTAKADQPDHRKYNTPKIEMDNEAAQKLHTS